MCGLESDSTPSSEGGAIGTRVRENSLGDILAEAARDVHPMAIHVLTESELGTTAVEAMAALQEKAVNRHGFNL